MQAVKQISSQAAAAKAIRSYLKEMGIKGSVTSESYSMGSSVRVSVTDLLPDVYKALAEFADKYQYGDFNGMEDIYEYRKDRDDLPKAKYVTVNNSYSDELGQEIYDYVKGIYSELEGAPEIYEPEGRNFMWYKQGYDNLVWRLFNGSAGMNFWDFKASKVKAAA